MTHSAIVFLFYRPAAMDMLLADAESWLRALIILGGAIVAGLIVHAVLFRVARTIVRRIPTVLVFDGAVLERARGPLRLILPLVAVYIALPFVEGALSADLQTLMEGLLHGATVLAIAWLLVALVMMAEDIIEQRYSMDEADNLQARKITTQVRILRRIAIIVIGVLSLGAILMQYEPFRELGTGILASAGIIGIVIGVAAQRTLGNLIAGIQIAFTQPIRVDDVVIAEGDFGWVEEITLTYVVVRVWDQRRIVVPITQFVEQPFQNWTRTSSELLGTVFLYVDHTVPFDDIRKALGEIVEASEYYDGRVWRLHVTDTSEKTVELRALMSAASAPDLWELRCAVREQLIAHVQERFPDALPRVRAELNEAGERGNGRAEEP
jgi:small-conductance mechanosensitive channel